MPNTFEPASSGRAKCRGCGYAIAQGELRFGERLPNPFGEGEMTLWFHLLCAAYKRPEPFLQTLGETKDEIPGREKLKRAAQMNAAHRRLPRIDGAECAPSSQAKCRHCREPIEKGSWRIKLVFYEDGRFSPGGFVHIGCRQAYFDTEEVFDQATHFSPDLSDADRQELRRALNNSAQRLPRSQSRKN
jgi:hypothetical protein